jgi:hypothetical protein
VSIGGALFRHDFGRLVAVLMRSLDVRGLELVENNPFRRRDQQARIQAN